MSPPAQIRHRVGRDSSPSCRCSLVTLALSLAMVVLSGCARFQQSEIDFGVPDTSYSRSDRGRTYVLDRGEGPAVLLIHGYGSAHDVYLALVDELVDAGYRVLAVDLPGFGRSDRLPGDYSPEGFARHLFALLDERQVESAHIIGHSWGCSIALRMALEHPERVSSLVLTSAWVYEEQIPPFLRWARVRGVGEALYTLFYRERVSDRYASSWYDAERFVTQEGIDEVERALARPGTARAALEAARGQRFAEVQERYRGIETPALLVWGRQDAVSTLDAGQRLEQDLPNARLVVLERCGHIPMIERADHFESEVLAFFEELSGDVSVQPVRDEPAATPAPSAERPWGEPPAEIDAAESSPAEEAP